MAAKHVHELPYGRNADRDGRRLVLEEGRGTCSTKHALLASVASEQRLPVFLTIGIYDMTAANTPGVGDVLAAHGLASIPEAHCYLRYRGARIDVTRAQVSATEGIAMLHGEWRISPSEIGERKLSLHRTFLEEWIGEHPECGLGLEELWAVREACIAALTVRG